MYGALTSGQERIRTIAQRLLHSFPDREYLSCDEHPLYAALRDALHQDAIVTSDPMTSAPLGNATISSNYGWWLDSISTPIGCMTGDDRVRFTMVTLQGSVGGSWGEAWDRPAFTGGIRFKTTMRAIYTIMAEQFVGTDQWHHTYYTRSDVLWGNTGNHRLLAYVLTGEQAIPSLTFCEEQHEPDPALNDMLHFLEQLWVNVQRGANPRPIQRFNLDLVSPQRRDADVARVRSLMQEASEQDWCVIAAYLHERWRERLSWLDAELAPQYSKPFDSTKAQSHTAILLQSLAYLRDIEGRGRIDQAVLRVQRRLGMKDQAATFERWYEQQHHQAFPPITAYADKPVRSL